MKYCMSVNDAFVMNAWAKNQDLKMLKLSQMVLKMGMLVKKDNLGFGMRSWRYAALVNDCIVEKMWIEKGMDDNTVGDSYGESSPENLLNFLK